MASVPLKFNPPEEEGLVALLIEEGPSDVGPFVQIEEVLNVGTYPDYIAEYTTDDAVSAVNWFRIRWRDDKGAHTPYTSPMQGGTTTLVAKVKDRVKQRDPSLVDAVVYQEVEAIVAEYFGVEDPYDPTLTASYKVLNGLTYLALARSYIFRLIQAGDLESAQLGLVKFTNSKGQGTVDIDALIDLANVNLGINTSRILQMEDIVRTVDFVTVMEP